jgi:hypothetical protein
MPSTCGAIRNTPSVVERLTVEGMCLPALATSTQVVPPADLVPLTSPSSNWRERTSVRRFHP